MSSGCRYIDRGTPESDIPASSQSDSRSNVVLEYLRVDPDTREIGNRVQRIADIVKFESVGLRFAVALERRTSIFEVSGCQITPHVFGAAALVGRATLISKTAVTVTTNAEPMEFAFD